MALQACDAPVALTLGPQQPLLGMSMETLLKPFRWVLPGHRGPGPSGLLPASLGVPLGLHLPRTLPHLAVSHDLLVPPGPSVTAGLSIRMSVPCVTQARGRALLVLAGGLSHGQDRVGGWATAPGTVNRTGSMARSCRRAPPRQTSGQTERRTPVGSRGHTTQI